MPRLRSVRRHLLAMCTFLVPLAVLAWLGQRELGRQANEARSAADREALQFLRTAAQALDQRFEQLLPAIEAEATELLAAPERTPAAVVRELRTRGYGAVRDLVLIGLDGRLRYPEVGTGRLALPFLRDARTGVADDEFGEVLHLCDLLLARERYEDAERHLAAAVAEASSQRDRGGRRRGEFTATLSLLQFRLATVQRKLGRATEALGGFQEIARQAASLRANPRMSRGFDRVFDTDLAALGLMSEVALAEADASGQAHLDLLAAIASGERDQLGEPVLAATAERLHATAPSTCRVEADLRWVEALVHVHTREFAADYDRLLRETVRRRLRAATEGSPTDLAAALRPVITAGTPSSLLMLHRAEPGKEERAPWVGIRLDLGQVLASAIEPFVRGDGSYVLAVADGDDLPVVAPPTAPDDYAPPALASHGMMLRAYPADVERWLTTLEQARRGAAVLLGGLFLVALVGAIWLWRSVSRESELLGLKVDLVSRVSHELKTPLSLINLYGETIALKRARDADQAAQFGNVITREAARLTTMIQRILDFSRQQAGTLVYEPQRSDLGEVLGEVLDTYEPHLEAKGARLSTELPLGIEAHVDRAALASVVLNLVENAVKYARDEDPSADIRVDLCRRGAFADIEVADRGRGVPEAEREAVFDSFYRASNAGEVRGAGLGLSLVRHFATAHGGTATVHPRDGGGSIFRLTLPIVSTTA